MKLRKYSVEYRRKNKLVTTVVEEMTPYDAYMRAYRLADMLSHIIVRDVVTLKEYDYYVK